MKGWCITATVLLLQLFIENIDTSEHDSPPVFTQLNTLKYIDPVIVNASDNGNVLQCTAVNADRVTWRYKKTVSTQDYDSLPQGLVQTNAFRNPTNGYLTRTLATDSTRSSTKLSFTGYYFCVASNNYGYFDESPPLHLITPEFKVKERGKTSVDVKTILKDRGAALLLSCIDWEQVELLPADLLNEKHLKYSWHKKYVGSTSMQIFEHGDRIQVDYGTGALFFAYLVPDDVATESGASFEYQCQVKLSDSSPAFLASHYKLELTSHSPVISPTILFFPTAAQDVTCLEGRTCSLTCFYSGRKIIYPSWHPPDNSIIFKEVESSIFFTASAAAAGIWRCNSVNAPQHGAARFKVTTLLRPRIDRNQLQDVIIPAGGSATFICSANGAITHRLYVNGTALSTERRLSTTGNSKLVHQVTNAQPEQSAAITCWANNEVGTAHKSVKLIVYKMPTFSLNNSNPLEATCLVEISGEKLLEPKVYWQSNHKQLANTRIFVKQPVGIASIVTDKSDYSSWGIITSTIRLEEKGPVHTRPEAKWWCGVTTTLFRVTDEHRAVSEPVTISPARSGFASSINKWALAVALPIALMSLIGAISGYYLNNMTRLRRRTQVSKQVTVEPQTVIAGKIEKEELFLIEPQHTLVEEVKPARVVPGKAVEITEEEENVQLKTAEKTMKSHGVGEDEELKPIKWAPTIGD